MPDRELRRMIVEPPSHDQLGRLVIDQSGDKLD
jgi:hypothetical protein